jgi:hypothetical protein
VFVDGFLVTEVARWSSVGFVAREWLAETDGVSRRDVVLTLRVVGRSQYIDVAD